MISKKNTLTTFITLVVIVFVLAIGIYFMSTTRMGLRLISNQMWPDILPSADVQIGDVVGHMADGVTLSQIELKNLKGLPLGNKVRIQRLMIRMHSLDPRDLEMDFENIRVFLPNSEPIVLSGQYRNGNIECNVYSRGISIDEILGFLPRPLASHPQGVIKDIDLYLQGPPSAAHAKGTFVIQELIMPRFTLTEAPGELSLIFKRTETGFAPSGDLFATKGKVKTKNAFMKLQKSTLFFNGSFGLPTFDIHGNASVGKVSMDIGLLGTPQAPMWQFSSNPSMPEEVLMLMFLTGKGFGTLPDTDLEQQKLTPDIAKDLVDYFLLGGEGGRIAEKFGIKDVAVIYDRNTATAGFGVTTAVTDFLDVGYQIEQQGVAGTSPGTSAGEIKHTFDTELKINPNVSLELDKEFYQSRNQESFGSANKKPDDKILLKYKTQF